MSGRRSRYLWKVATAEALAYMKSGELNDNNAEQWRTARYRELKRSWSRRDHRPGCQYDPPGTSQAKKSEAAIRRGEAEKREREDIYRKHPKLRYTGTRDGARWMPIQNLRRAARQLGAS